MSLEYELNLKKTNNIQEIFRLAECIVDHLLYVRIDFYNIKGKIYFGEITFHQGFGFERIELFEYKLGDLLNLRNR